MTMFLNPAVFASLRDTTILLLTVIIGLLDLRFLPIHSTLAVMLISPALILQPAVFPRSIAQVIISAAAEVRPPPPHETAASPPALLPTPSAPAGVTLKFIKGG